MIYAALVIIPVTLGILYLALAPTSRVIITPVALNGLISQQSILVNKKVKIVDTLPVLIMRIALELIRLATVIGWLL